MLPMRFNRAAIGSDKCAVHRSPLQEKDLKTFGIISLCACIRDLNTAVVIVAPHHTRFHMSRHHPALRTRVVAPYRYAIARVGSAPWTASQCLRILWQLLWKLGDFFFSFLRSFPECLRLSLCVAYPLSYAFHVQGVFWKLLFPPTQHRLRTTKIKTLSQREISLVR